MKSARPASNTPMMAQYLAIRDAHPGYLLFYRMGDFYELFFEDAVAAAGALDIALTRRGRHDGEDIPMAGVPVRAHEAYLERLIRKGFKVAICEQTEDPAEARKRGSGTVVAREAVRLVTPGTLTEDALLEARRHNYLAVLAEANGGHALAWADISTGDFQVESVEAGGLPVLLARIEPSELVLPEAMLEEAAFDGTVTALPAARFDSENARRRLLEAFDVATLEGFGRFDRAQQTACGVLIDYLDLTQKGRLPRLEPPRPAGPGGVLEIDPATRRNLELTATLAGERRGSLLATVDRTRSAGGGRLLAAWLSAPLTDPAAITARHDAVDRLCRDERLRRDLAGRLGRAPDIERSLSRLGLGRGGPRDLAAIRDALALAGEIADLFDAPPPLLDTACAALRGDPVRIGQQSHLAGVLDGTGHSALLLGIVARDTASADLPPVGHETPKQLHILVIDVLHPLVGENADLLLAAPGVVPVLRAGSTLRHNSSCVRPSPRRRHARARAPTPTGRAGRPPRRAGG